MIDFKTLGLQSGQKLRIQTKNEIILGLYKSISQDGSRMEISNPQRLDGRNLGKVRWIYEADVESIKAERLAESDVNLENLASELEPKLFSPSITQFQIERIYKMMEDTEYINQANSSYFKALLEISESLFIGVFAENTDSGKLSKAEFLQISTSSKLYVYDLRSLNTKRLFDDLRHVLEGQAYLKILYDSRFLLDNLNTHYNLKIAPVCDLLVILSIERDVAFKDLNHCLNEMFSLNREVEQKNESVWRRPVKHEQLVTLSYKVAFLIPLYAQLNQFKLQEKYGKTMNEYSTIAKNDFYKEVLSKENEKLNSVLRKFHENGE